MASTRNQACRDIIMILIMMVIIMIVTKTVIIIQGLKVYVIKFQISIYLPSYREKEGQQKHHTFSASSFTIRAYMMSSGRTLT